MDIINIFKAVFLGIIEGLTEFIPVSSTGHLILIEDLLGFQGPPGKTFEIIIQLGAILAICWLYRHKIISVLMGLTKEKKEQKFALNIIAAFIPAMILGVLLHGFIKRVLFSPYVVSTSLIVGGIIILIIESRTRKIYCNSIDELSLKKSGFIGLFQCLAMIPGVSRSGATIMGSLLLGVERKAATEFSFFLAIPTMFAATIFDIYKNLDVLSFDNFQIIAIGFISAFLAALLVVKKLINFVGTHGFKPFAYYRIAIGVIMLALLAHSA